MQPKPERRRVASLREIQLKRHINFIVLKVNIFILYSSTINTATQYNTAFVHKAKVALGISKKKLKNPQQKNNRTNK